MDLLTACRDPNLFQPWFRDPATWAGWFVFLRALFGMPIDGEADLAVYTRCTGRAVLPSERASEAWIVAGRRSGKSFILSLVATYLATFLDWRPYLAPGERATVMVIATDRKQARVIMRYLTALLEECPLIRPMVERTVSGSADNWSVDLDNRVTIEVHSASFRTVRGYTICAALCDETAFWRAEESANPDREVIEAIRPALATVPGSMLLCASSPYARRGALWEAHRRYYAKDGPVLIWQAATEVMNPTVPRRVVEDALERDDAIGRSEWLAEFRRDIEGYMSREAVEACIEPGVRERAPVAGLRYVAFCDPSGGRADPMTLAVGHREDDCAVLDCLREVRPPFDPASVVAEFAEMLKSYCVLTVRGDKYAGEWPVREFRKHGVTYQAAEKVKSELYRELLPAVTARRVELLDHPKVVTQLVGLERRVGRGGRDSIDHAPGAHDDLANAVAGVVQTVLARVHVPLVW
jgi:hypothetical protein